MDKPFHKCRFCSKLGEFCSIFDKDDNIQLSEMVMSFANIQIYEGDGKSDRVCSSCIENLSTAYLFKLQCEKVHSITKPAGFTQATSKNIDFLDRDFYIHTADSSMEEENDQNCLIDLNINNHHESSKGISDGSDSEIDSIKCVYCNEYHNNVGTHTCQVVCTIEHNHSKTDSNETLVAMDAWPQETTVLPNGAVETSISCLLCDEKFWEFSPYKDHIDLCTRNVKLHHIVCPLCHEIFTDKLVYLQHVKDFHFKNGKQYINNNSSIDCVDSVPFNTKTSKSKAVRRIGWSTEDIYQEIELKTEPKVEFITSSPIKPLGTQLIDESQSKNNTPKKVSFRSLFANGTAKTANYLPFRKYIQNYKLKKKNNYSPIKGTMQISSTIRACLPETVSDSDYGSPGGTSEESWKLKQKLICACDKKIFMLSEYIHDRDRVVAMIHELGGVVAENTKMEMLATHFISVLPDDTFTGMMVCALSTGKWMLHVHFVYDSFRCKKFLDESLYEWIKQPKLLELDCNSVEITKAAVYWHLELQALSAKFPFEGKQIILIMKKKYRQYYHMIFKTLKAKPLAYDPRTPGSCCSADYCFVDMKIIERVKLNFFSEHNIPVFPYQYVLVYLLNKGKIEDEQKYMIQKCIKKEKSMLNHTY